MSRWISTKSIGKLLIILPVLLLVALACGDDETPVPTSTSAPPTPTPTTAAAVPGATETPTTVAETPVSGATETPTTVAPTPPSGSTSTPTTAAVAPTAVPTPTATTSAPPVDVMPEGALIIAVPNLGRESFNPKANSGVDRNYLKFIMDILVGSDADGNLDKSFGIAEDWEMSSDAMTWTIRYRKGIEFSNGDPVTAEDTKFVLSLVMAEDSRSTYKNVFVNAFGTVDNVDIPDPHTLVINTVVPAPLLISGFSDTAGADGFLRPKEYIEAIGGPDEFAKKPIGSGPFLLSRQRAGDFMEFEARDTAHWRIGVPKFKTVTLRVIPEENTRVAALQVGEVDVIGVARERLKGLEADGFLVHRQELYSVIGWYFHDYWLFEGSPFADINFRKAFNLAINREEICEFIFAGECANSGQYLWPAIAPGFPKDMVPYPYDPDGAMAALADSSYDGREITMHALILADTPEAVRMAEAIAGMAQAVGINAKVNPTDFSVTQPKRIAHTLNDQMTYFSAHNRNLAAMVSLSQVIGPCDGIVTATCEPFIDELIPRMTETLDENERLSLMTDLINFIHDNYLYLHIIDFSPVYVTNDKGAAWNPGTKPYEQNFISMVTR